MDATPRLLLFAFCAAAVCVALPACKRARALTPVDMTGIWRVDRGFAPNSANPPLPDSFYACTLTLNADGSFIASTLPADFFYTLSHTYKAPEYRGTWKVGWAGAENALTLNFPGEKGSFFAPVEERTGKYGILIERGASAASFYLTKSDSASR